MANTLEVSLEVAARVCAALDETAPNIKRYTRELINRAKYQPYVTNWYGRRYHFKPDFVYKFPNYRIQGGCSDILRIAICQSAALLKAEAKGDSFIMLPIHDELVLNLAECDSHLAQDIRQIMISANQPVNGLPMDVSISVGDNFADIEKAT